MVVVWGWLPNAAGPTPNAAGPTLLSEERCGTAPACSSWGQAGQEVKVRRGTEQGPAGAVLGCCSHCAVPSSVPL